MRMPTGFLPCLILIGALNEPCDAEAQKPSDAPQAIRNMTKPIETEPPEFALWYGDEQSFGQLGHSQPLINILGSATHSENVVNASYRLNGRRTKQIVLGPDLHRLANAGDFNLEIERSQLKPGKNTVSIRAQTRSGKPIAKSLKFDYDPDTTWPLPYEVDFTSVDNLQDVVEIIDGRWTLTDDGVRIAEPYYDRQLSFGDSNWTDFDLRAEVLFHHHFVNVAGRNINGPPYLSHAHASFNMRWNGHPDDGFSPRRDWMNLGSLVALRRDLDQINKGSYWWLHFGKGIVGRPAKRSLSKAQRRFPVAPETRWHYRIRVETIDEFQSCYSAKLWPDGETEPADWQMEAVDASEAVSAGSVVFVVHHSDVTLCRVRVDALNE